MERVYYELVKIGSKTINQVPKRIREDVIKLLEENGYKELVNADN